MIIRNIFGNVRPLSKLASTKIIYPGIKRYNTLSQKSLGLSNFLKIQKFKFTESKPTWLSLKALRLYIFTRNRYPLMSSTIDFASFKNELLLDNRSSLTGFGPFLLEGVDDENDEL